MENKIGAQLEEAKQHFLAWRMVEAYGLFRRFFDRLPFQPERQHAEYIGMFVRVLGELGKLNELKFYVVALERAYDIRRDAGIGYTLAVVYMNLSEARPEAARRILDLIVRDESAKEFHVKAKMVLANYYDRFKSDPASCRALIESIGPVADPGLNRLVGVWRGKIWMDEKRYPEAIALMRALAREADLAGDWFGGFSAENILAVSLVKSGDIEEAQKVVDGLRQKFQARNFKTVQLQLASLQGLIQAEGKLGPLLFIPGDNASTFVYSSRKLVLKRKTAAEQLLTLLLKKRMVDKNTIVRELYRREYDPAKDDKTVYYQIHYLRKRLTSIGVPPQALIKEAHGYRWVTEVQRQGE